MSYYDTCALAKPTNKKKKPLYNGYKDKSERICFYCGTNYAERHEVYGGSNKKISIAHQFQVDLCTECHREIEANITQQAIARNDYWERHYQALYETKLIALGTTPEDARKLWMAMIGRNYLD